MGMDVNDMPVRKVLGWTAALLGVLVTLAFLFGLEFLKAWADEKGFTVPGWVFIPLGAIILFGLVCFGIAFFGSRGRAVRREHRERMRRLKNFELDEE
jgi:hypothetical protein